MGLCVRLSNIPYSIHISTIGVRISFRVLQLQLRKALMYFDVCNCTMHQL